MICLPLDNTQHLDVRSKIIRPGLGRGRAISGAGQRGGGVLLLSGPGRGVLVCPLEAFPVQRRLGVHLARMWYHVAGLQNSQRCCRTLSNYIMNESRYLRRRIKT